MLASPFREDGAGGRQICLREEDLIHLFMVWEHWSYFMKGKVIEELQKKEAKLQVLR